MQKSYVRFLPLVSDNNATKPGGRKSKSTLSKEKEGERIRDFLAINLAIEDLVRPTTTRMKYNALGLMYFE